MNEGEILEQLFGVYDRYWTIVQWWSSVSFSLIIVAYLAADRLSKGIVATLLGLYTLYSVWVGMFMGHNINIILAIRADLESLRAAGSLRSQEALIVLQDPLAVHGAWLGISAQIATFFACVGYLLYAVSQAKKNANT